MNILSELVTYLAAKCDLEPGENIFYNSLPDEPDTAVLLQQSQQTVPTPSPIGATSYIVEVTVRSLSNETAYDMGCNLYRWLYTSQSDTEDADGIVTIAEGRSIATAMLGEPVWKQTDNKGRKYFVFRVRVFSHRII